MDIPLLETIVDGSQITQQVVSVNLPQNHEEIVEVEEQIVGFIAPQNHEGIVDAAQIIPPELVKLWTSPCHRNTSRLCSAHHWSSWS